MQSRGGLRKESQKSDALHKQIDPRREFVICCFVSLFSPIVQGFQNYVLRALFLLDSVVSLSGKPLSEFWDFFFYDLCSTWG